MPIYFTCGCGKSLNAPDGSSGKRARCPACGAINTIPIPPADPDELDLAPIAAPEPQHAPARTFTSPPPPRQQRIDPATAYQTESPFHQQMAAAAAEPPFWRKYLYFVLLLALLPIAILTFTESEDPSGRNPVQQTIDAHPEDPGLEDRIEAAVKRAQALYESGQISESEADQIVFNAFPNHKVEGAFLAHESKAHWMMALVSAVFFFTVMLLIFPSPGTKAHSLIFAGIFTGTVGILVLLGFQWCAANAAGANVRVWHGKAAIIFLIIKLIGWSYYLANHPEFGFFASFVGFTVGVGLCEEFVKIIPVLIRIKPGPGKDDPTWQGLLLWGLASGVGFGVAEGIMYSGEHYNGIYGSNIYLVRFASCVVLHSIWTAAAAVTLFNRQGSLHNSDTAPYIFNVILCIGISILLHGLYDVLLSQEHPVWALMVAIASFGYLCLQIERMRKKEHVPASYGFPVV